MKRAAVDVDDDDPWSEFVNEHVPFGYASNRWRARSATTPSFGFEKTAASGRGGGGGGGGERWTDSCIADLPALDDERGALERARGADAHCRACDDALPSERWREFALTRNRRTATVYACSACYEKMRRVAAAERWRGSMHAYICRVFDERRYWDSFPP